MTVLLKACTEVWNTRYNQFERKWTPEFFRFAADVSTNPAYCEKTRNDVLGEEYGATFNRSTMIATFPDEESKLSFLLKYA